MYYLISPLLLGTIGILLWSDNFGFKGSSFSYLHNINLAYGEFGLKFDLFRKCNRFESRQWTIKSGKKET